MHQGLLETVLGSSYPKHSRQMLTPLREGRRGRPTKPPVRAPVTMRWFQESLQHPSSRGGVHFEIRKELTGQGHRKLVREREVAPAANPLFPVSRQQDCGGVGFAGIRLRSGEFVDSITR